MSMADDIRNDLEDDDWEDPYNHLCTGCDMCATWEGKPYNAIRAERERALADKTPAGE